MPLPYTHQHYPKHRHRLTADATIESRKVLTYADELAQTPSTLGWVDLARDLFEQQVAMRAVNIEAAPPIAKEMQRARRGHRGGPIASD